ncbi:tRNA(fMet)-specific endonuclease VapC [bioreactor metagenome]|uniref:tRNA(fMet)-specific endonuclease VapC n=1 Tax=bioreactor metagenome TaxID=1076179 RepID=A0A645BC91_9ZZZZ|nr:MAG: hypothetical protein BGO33_04600 [Bacteroidia bacterium 43-41]
MNGIRILCDTNTLLYLLQNNELVVDFLMGKQVYISAITELELFGRQNMNEEEIAVIEELVDSCFVFDLLSPIKQIVKEIKRKYKIKLPDAIIAATAIYLDIPLVTFDDDFKNIEELQLVLLKM